MTGLVIAVIILAVVALGISRPAGQPPRNPNALEPDVFGGDGNADLDPESDTDFNR